MNITHIQNINNSKEKLQYTPRFLGAGQKIMAGKSKALNRSSIADSYKAAFTSLISSHFTSSGWTELN